MANIYLKHSSALKEASFLWEKIRSFFFLGLFFEIVKSVLHDKKFLRRKINMVLLTITTKLV